MSVPTGSGNYPPGVTDNDPLEKKDTTNSDSHFLEASNYALDDLHKLLERWNNRLTLDDRHTLAEHYVKGQLELVTEFEITWKGTRHKYCAVANAHTDAVGTELRTAHIGHKPHGHHIQHSDVFVCDVEIMNGTKWRTFPSRVWFEPSNFVNDVFAGLVYFSIFNSAFKMRRISRKWEAGVITILSGESDEIASEEIERGTQVMDCISGRQGDLRRHLLPDAYRHVAPFGISIFLHDDDIRLSFGKFPDLSFEIIDVLLGPFDL